MRTRIIDSSLCRMDFSAHADKDSVEQYAAALFSSGVDYIEIGRNALPFFQETNTSSHYIYRIESGADMKLMGAKDFAFVVLPFELLYFAPFTKHSVILEINIDGKEIYEDLNKINSRFEMNFVSMIRFVGDFSDRMSEMQAFTKVLKRKTPFSVDICPLDTTLSGTDAAMTAFKAKTDAITLSLCSDGVYTGLEKFLITAAFMHKSNIHPSFMMGLCLAVLCLTNVSASPFDAMIKVNEIIGLASDYTINIDTPKNNERLFKLDLDRQNEKPSFDDKFFEALQIDDSEFRDELKKAVETSRMNLFKPEQKQNSNRRKKLQ